MPAETEPASVIAARQLAYDAHERNHTDRRDSRIRRPAGTGSAQRPPRAPRESPTEVPTARLL